MEHDIPSLDEVKLHFDHWRTTRSKRERIPVYLWDMVKQIIDSYSLTQITTTLSINTNQIKDNIDIKQSINFVEALYVRNGLVKVGWHGGHLAKQQRYCFARVSCSSYWLKATR